MPKDALRMASSQRDAGKVTMCLRTRTVKTRRAMVRPTLSSDKQAYGTRAKGPGALAQVPEGCGG